MITNKMRFQLSMLGYDKQEMKHLTPEQCWEIINRAVPKEPSRVRPVMNLNEKSHRIKNIFIIFIIYFQFVHPHFNNEKKSEYLH